MGGNVELWHALFRKPLKLELHVMEFNETCARAWSATGHNSRRATMHLGNPASSNDLNQMFDRAGNLGFDLVADDGSHRPADQLATLKEMLGKRRVRAGGAYIIEDLHHPNHLVPNEELTVLFDKVVMWQLSLKRGHTPLPGVRHIAFYQEAVAFPIHADTESGASRRASPPFPPPSPLASPPALASPPPPPLASPSRNGQTEALVALRKVVGADPRDDHLLNLLAHSKYDVNAATNEYFKTGLPPSPPPLVLSPPPMLDARAARKAVRAARVQALMVAAAKSDRVSQGSQTRGEAATGLAELP